MRRRTTRGNKPGRAEVFQSTLSLRRRTSSSTRERRHFIISIHPLLAEKDARRRGRWAAPGDFNPPSPCGEGQAVSCNPFPTAEFQSTLSLRRRTQRISGQCWEWRFQSTLSLRRRTTEAGTLGGFRRFQSTLSLRRRTAKVHKTGCET